MRFQYDDGEGGQWVALAVVIVIVAGWVIVELLT